ncbi:hypothetical protein N7519_007762 [Penicillium mononematosum]|uniref:uncharacterized protein n=1 Tax=Penicillium mononematosum TaxID=268346 RepID=UPI0025480796|nr:uncharacterized protein N7519_007762 [Penicillium mononematosum]KAJ6186461.1 hypothetical protein N7519_007762 [Penicillium mononematosum]
MAAAGVILGLLPTTLCLVGSSTAETGLLALRRPLLSLLLVCGAPVASPIRTFEYRGPIDLVRKRSKSIDASRFTPLSAAVIVALQYIFAFLAVANLAHVSWELMPGSGTPFPLPKYRVKTWRAFMGKEAPSGIPTDCTTVACDTP